MMRANLLTDVAGVAVGHADDPRLASGVTCVLFDAPVIASGDVRGGGPATRDAALLEPGRTVERVDGFVLAGGSAFGLDAGGGVQAFLREAGRGFPVGTARVPIVPGAVIFDLTNGGDKDWGRFPPYRDLGYAAAAAAKPGPFRLGSVGAGLGATTRNLKGGLGSASDVTPDGITVAALALVNACGSAVLAEGPWFRAATVERDGEFGGLGLPAAVPEGAHAPLTKGMPGASTTLVVVVTDAALDRTRAQRLAVMAQDGFPLALHPVHTPLDGDLVFTAATGARPLPDPVFALARLGAVAAHVVARAITRGVHAATALPFPGAIPAWRDRFGGR